MEAAHRSLTTRLGRELRKSAHFWANSTLPPSSMWTLIGFLKKPKSTTPSSPNRPCFTSRILGILLLKIRSRRVVVQQIVRRNQIARRVARDQLAGDAVHPGILLQANLAADVVHLVAP